VIKDTSTSKRICLEDFLLEVKKPAQYIAGEINSINKTLKDEDIHFALCFPDAYEVGMSHLGIKILYDILNKQNDLCAERCFAPWPDMEKQLRQRGIELFSLESRQPIKNFDVVGFSLQYELSYTNVLLMLDLAGIPLHGDERGAHPIVIAGGPCACNPEPMAEFIDVFFIGEAEDSILEFVREYRIFKKSVDFYGEGFKGDVFSAREKFLKRLALIEGVYVPRFYKREKTQIYSKLDLRDKIPAVVKRRYVKDLNKADFFVKPPVPYVDIIHDRIVIEIMRGCPNRCFFCQAGHTIKPVRLRSIDTIMDIARKTYKFTGYDDVSFCALSSGDYPDLKVLIKKMFDFCSTNGMGLSLPSLRIDEDFFGALTMIGSLKKTGITFAPEAGSERLRKIINKNIDIEHLKKVILEAYRAGWKKLKLYFMIGLPGETEKDLLDIVQLIDECSALRKIVDKKRGKINVGISNFIPKPHTPFQWLGMDNRESLLEKQEFLKKHLNKRYLNMKLHDVDMSFMEASLSRGGRNLSTVIEKAYLNGARFDGWTGKFNFSLWQQAFSQAAINPREIVCQPKDLKSELAWEHISCAVKKDVLIENFKSVLPQLSNADINQLFSQAAL